MRRDLSIDLEIHTSNLSHSLKKNLIFFLANHYAKNKKGLKFQHLILFLKIPFTSLFNRKQPKSNKTSNNKNQIQENFNNKTYIR